jgi:DNA helicase-2/ATP-dependent DNA helicase PcrA
MHAAKGLEFPVVAVIAIEQGIIPHERSLAKEDQVEEERRLLFVGMTRAKEELYLTHARLRDFRGSTMYAIPSMFLDELPEDVERADLSGGMRVGVERWRGGSPESQEGWREAGVGPRSTGGAARDYAEGMQVRHERYGVGRIVEVGGRGALRKVRVRFSKAGERTFLVNQVQLEIIPDSGGA